MYFAIYEVFIFVIKIILVGFGLEYADDQLVKVAMGFNVIDLIAFMLFLWWKPCQSEISLKSNTFIGGLFLLESAQLLIIIPGLSAITLIYDPNSFPGQVGFLMLMVSALIPIHALIFHRWNWSAVTISIFESAWTLLILLGAITLSSILVLIGGIGLIAVLLTRAIYYLEAETFSTVKGGDNDFIKILV